MVDERRDVEFPLWRRKVDGTLLENSQFVIPDWVKEGTFNIKDLFSESSKKHPSSEISIELKFDGTISKHKGWITTTRFGEKWSKKRAPVMRMFFDKDLKNRLQKIFTMSHMRDLERRIRANKTEESKCTPAQIEAEFPFFEFLDIEWDLENRKMLFRPHYIQAPVYTELFSKLQSKRILERIEDEIGGKQNSRISKGNWKPKSEIKSEITTENVIYTLIDTENCEVYVGEAKNLANRFKQERHEIPGWTHYRVDDLPDDFDDKMRINLERMMIRTLASLLENSANIDSMQISEYVLKNKRIDR